MVDIVADVVVVARSISSLCSSPLSNQSFALSNLCTFEVNAVVRSEIDRKYIQVCIGISMHT